MYEDLWTKFKTSKFPTKDYSLQKNIHDTDKMINFTSTHISIYFQFISADLDYKCNEKYHCH